ncbi:MAG: M6 family metalloprotease domain-containing protein [Candidatus Marinimicrobia bacterium]|nr:M6 family metalloprotease domain-containing protein [Candidatus Neomarinimicrobiota bacterium]
MKKTILTHFLLTCFAVNLYGTSASPSPIELSQPDGSTFVGHIRGNPRQSWYEANGWSIVKNGNNWWVYANGINDTKLLPSEAIVGRDESPETNPNLNHITTQLIPNAIAFEDNSPIPSLTHTRSDTFFVPCVLIDFSNYAQTYSQEELEQIWNMEGYTHPGEDNTGSFRDFYQEISYQQFLPISTLGDWFTSSHSHDYFANSNPNGYTHLKELIRQAVDEMEANGFDWSKFDNDGDGYVDALNVIHAGPGAEEGDETNIWSHKWSLGSYAVQYDGVTISSYTVNPEIQGGNIVAIGVLCHEFGHALGLPDLYDTDYTSSGSGKLALMGSGSWGTSGNSPYYPSAMNAWCKTELGWTNVYPLNQNLDGMALQQSYSSNLVYKVDHPTDNSEYWLIENRQKVGTDTLMPSPGFAIWHIDEEMTATGWAPNNNEPHYGVALEQADGLFELENGGSSDGGDTFPGTTNNREFSHTSVPSSHSYYGYPSMIRIDAISDPAETMTFDIEFNEIITATAYPISGSGYAFSEGTMQIGFENDMDLQSISFSLNFSPAPLEITDVQILDRLSVDSIAVDGFDLTLYNPVLTAGSGPILELSLFANTGAFFECDVTLENVLATRHSDGAEIGMIFNQSATYTIYSQDQIYSINDGTGIAGGTASYDVALNNSVPIRMLVFTLIDTPDLLIPADEPFTDLNGNGMWDQGEAFDDWNNNGSWSPAIETTLRTEHWDISYNYVESGIQVLGNSWEYPIEIGDGPIFKMNNQVDASANVGQVINLELSGELMMDYLGNTNMSYVDATGIITITQTSGTGVDGLPDSFKIFDAFPNPFNPKTTISYTLPQSSVVDISIFNLLGQKVLTDKSHRSEGMNTFVWSGQSSQGNLLGSGTYFIHIKTENNYHISKVILLK